MTKTGMDKGEYKCGRSETTAAQGSGLQLGGGDWREGRVEEGAL